MYEFLFINNLKIGTFLNKNFPVPFVMLFKYLEQINLIGHYGKYDGLVHQLQGSAAHRVL